MKKANKNNLADAIRAARNGDIIYVLPEDDTLKSFAQKIRIDKGGNNMPSRTIMDHTKMRFNSMTQIQLWTRMGRTTTPEKLEAFAIVAEERGHMDLAIAARARLATITGSLTKTSLEKEFEKIAYKSNVSKNKPKSQERLLRKIDR